MARRSKSSLRGFDLLSSGVGRNERTIGRITGDEGEAMVRRGRAQRILHSDTSDIVGYQLCAARTPTDELQRMCNRRPPPVFVPVPGSDSSSAAFSAAEVDAIAGHVFSGGKSRTESLSEEERAKRILRKWRGEDIVEASRQKLKVYKQVH